MNQSKYYSGYIDTWHNSTPNETYQVDTNFSGFDTNSNHTVQYRQNATGDFVNIGTVNSTTNQSISLSTKYQNTDLRTWCFGNGTSTCYLSSLTFWTQIRPPTIISWWNSKTGDNTLTFSAARNEYLLFRADADQVITTWTWSNATQINGTGLTYSYADVSFPVGGSYTVSVSGTNTYGTTQTITWNLTIGLSGLILDGYVNNTLGAPIQYAKMSLDSNSKFTNDTGYYAFTGLGDGDYTVTVQAIGYTSQTSSVVLTGNQTANFTLTESTGTDNDEMLAIGLMGGLVFAYAFTRKRKQNKTYK